MLQPRQMIPTFTLRATDGTEYLASMYRGRRSLVLIFPGQGEGEFVRELAARKAEIEEEDAHVLVITSGASELNVFQVLIDPDDQVRRRFGVGSEATVYLTDPYGEIYSAYQGNDIPDADEVLASLRHINTTCPE